jgi:hypothetical protein
MLGDGSSSDSASIRCMDAFALHKDILFPRDREIL